MHFLSNVQVFLIKQENEEVLSQATQTLCMNHVTLGSLRYYGGDGNGNENVISKYNFSFVWLFRDYSNLFNMKNAGELSRD